MIDWFNVYVGEMSGFYITKTSPRSYHVNANKQICQHQAIFRPWIFCQLRKSFVRLIYGYPSTIHQILKRSWQHHFLANRLSQRWTRKKTYRNMCDKHVLKSYAHVRLNEKKMHVDLLISILLVCGKTLTEIILVNLYY